jgi:hypothetical protein
MKDGIHIPAGVVRLLALLFLAAAAYAAYQEFPAARRYLKIESYSYS